MDSQDHERASPPSAIVSAPLTNACPTLLAISVALRLAIVIVLHPLIRIILIFTQPSLNRVCATYLQASQNTVARRRKPRDHMSKPLGSISFNVSKPGNPAEHSLLESNMFEYSRSLPVHRYYCPHLSSRYRPIYYIAFIGLCFILK